jgi:LysR family transcriptional regulator, hca operon transcriptional activator
MVKWKPWQRVRDRKLVPCVLLLRTYVGAPGALEKDFVSWGVCLEDMESAMELRHLRYFIAVAEAGSLTVAAEQKLHTAQPSLSRQIRDLEYEVGVPLMNRSVHGIELTAAGRAFLDHARLAITQAEAAAEAARRAALPARKTFAIGFQTGHEINWLPRAMHVLRDELKNIQVTISSDYSPDLAEALVGGRLDVAFLRTEPTFDLCYEVVDHEPLIVLMPSDHRLTSREAIHPREFVGEIFIGGSNKAAVLRAVTEDYLRRSGLDIKLDHGVDNMAMAMSLVASTRGLALMPAYAENLLPWSVVSRPLEGEAPTIDLAVGYSKANTSPILKLFLSKIDELTTRTSGKARNLRT